MTQQTHVVNDSNETVLQQALASKRAIEEIYDSLLEKVEEVLAKYPVL
ncbi:hypothetical protein [uncultured phage]|nr:hypothetical protein [uncultured phage]